MVLPLLFPALIGAQLVFVSDEVPRLNVEPGCRAAAESAVGPGRNANSCQDDEYRARDQLAKEWSQFSGADRSRCMRLAGLGGQPSYVELLTCLEMARDVKNSTTGKAENTLDTGGRGGVLGGSKSR